MPNHIEWPRIQTRLVTPAYEIKEDHPLVPKQWPSYTNEWDYYHIDPLFCMRTIIPNSSSNPILSMYKKRYKLPSLMNNIIKKIQKSSKKHEHIKKKIRKI